MDVLDADISINDEATANVAPENEADLMNAVEELMIIPGLFEPPVRTLRATIPENGSHIFR